MNTKVDGNNPGLAGRAPLLILACHFSPSRAVGARRVTALALDLENHLIPSIVVSTFGNIDPATAALPAAVKTVWVRQTETRILKSIAAAKRAVLGTVGKFRRTAQPRAVPSRSSGSANNVNAPKRESVIVRIATLIDLDKRWSFAAAREAYRVGLMSKPFAVLCSGPPMSSIVAASWVAKKLAVPLILDFRDPWIKNMPSTLHGAINKLEASIELYFERRALARAAVIVTATAGMADHLGERYPEWRAKIRVVRNGFDGEPKSLRTSTGHRLNILFAGEIYLHRDPFPLLDALDRLLSQPHVDASRVTVTLVGSKDAELASALDAWIETKGRASNVKIMEPVPFTTIVQMTEEATVLLNLAQQAFMMVPAKAYEHVASGREILLISERSTDVFQLFGNVPGITFVESSKSAQLDAALADLYERHVRHGVSAPPPHLAAQPFSRVTQLALYRSIILSSQQPH